MIRHRGPDQHGYQKSESVQMGHERLAIMGISSGEQPIIDGDWVLAVNGEIQNQREMFSQYYLQGSSDCHSLIYFQQKQGLPHFLSKVRGMFAFSLFNKRTGEVIIARDPVGIIPLQQGYSSGHLAISSELKCLDKICQTVHHFPPGHYLQFNVQDFAQQRDGQKFISQCEDLSWFNFQEPKFVQTPHDTTEDQICKVIREKLIETVESHMMTEVPQGLLLSGGLDSSLIASIAQRIASKKGLKLKSFCIGGQGSQDILAAEKVAKFIGTDHQSFDFNVEEGLMFMQDIIYHIETQDYTVRSSTPMYFMAKRIASLGLKFVLSGEGSDEIFGGQLQFHKAPNELEFSKECQRKLKRLQLFDCLRANKVMMAWGIEARVPFLDSQFLKLIMDEISPCFKLTNFNQKRVIEKYILRKAFDTPEDPFLPDEVLWRQKEQFQDGVGQSWVDGLKEHTSRMISDFEQEMRDKIYEFNTPFTKEDFYQRTLFEKMFGLHSARTVFQAKSVACSTEEAIKWDKSFDINESSGRGVIFHNTAYSNTVKEDEEGKKDN